MGHIYLPTAEFSLSTRTPVLLKPFPTLVASILQVWRFSEFLEAHIWAVFLFLCSRKSPFQIFFSSFAIMYCLKFFAPPLMIIGNFKLSQTVKELDNSSKLGSTQKIDKVNSEDSTIYILKLVSLRLVTLLKIYHIRYICNYD